MKLSPEVYLGLRNNPFNFVDDLDYDRDPEFKKMCSGQYDNLDPIHNHFAGGFYVVSDYMLRGGGLQTLWLLVWTNDFLHTIVVAILSFGRKIATLFLPQFSKVSK